MRPPTVLALSLFKSHTDRPPIRPCIDGDDCLCLSVAAQERVLVGLVGATESSMGPSTKDSAGSRSSDTAVGGISVGDCVVRGPSWNWGEDHDGGPGGYGTVVDVRRRRKGQPLFSFVCGYRFHLCEATVSALYLLCVWNAFAVVRGIGIPVLAHAGTRITTLMYRSITRCSHLAGGGVVHQT